MPQAEYIGVKDIEGPFISLSEKATLVQVFTGTGDLVPNTTKVRFLGKPLEVHLSKYMLGRTFNGLGEPRDGCGEIYGGKRVNINGCRSTRWRASTRETSSTLVSPR